MKKIVAIILGIIGIIVVVGGMMTKIKRNASVSIIGGADGPTAIFLAGKVEDGWFVTVMITGVILILVGIILLLKKKK